MLLSLLFLAIAGTVFAQAPAGDQKTLEYLQGDGVYESGVMVFLKGLKDSVWSHFDLFITDAKALSAIFMIIFFCHQVL